MFGGITVVDKVINVIRIWKKKVQKIKIQGVNIMQKKEANKKGALQPAPKVLVSCRGVDGKDNALVVGYCGKYSR